VTDATERVNSYLQYIFGQVNAVVFNGKLPPASVEYITGTPLGQFWRDQDGAPHIGINLDILQDAEKTTATMIHEAQHYTDDLQGIQTETTRHLHDTAFYERLAGHGVIDGEGLPPLLLWDLSEIFPPEVVRAWQAAGMTQTQDTQPNNIDNYISNRNNIE